MELIKQTFDKQFAYWELVFPEESLKNRSPGSLLKGGWSIKYHFGNEDGEEFLEYLAMNRMTNDTLYRIYADGRKVIVDEAQEFYEVGNEQAKQAYYDNNKKFYDLVKERGLYP
jgi:hypothetical protein